MAGDVRVERIGEAGPAIRAGRSVAGGFGDLLAVQLSNHARRRLGSEELAPTVARDLGAAMAELSRKGANRSVVLLGNEAYLVSVKNRTVVTHFGEERLRGTVIQGIDAVYIAAGPVGPGTGEAGGPPTD